MIAVDFLDRGRARGGESEIDNRYIDGRHAHGEAVASFPFSSGSTKPTAAAAPVRVGIMLIVAERARRKSSWYTSVSTWSLV